MRRLLNFPLSLFFLSVGFMFPLSTNANVIKKSYAKNKLEQHKLELCKAIKFSLGEKNFVEFKEYENLMIAPCTGLPGEIGGKVFGDFNYDGLDNEISGLPDIIVNIYDCDGNEDNQLLQTTTTDVNGQYTFVGLTDGVRYKLEFIVPAHLPNYQEAFLGDNGGAIQFITAPSCSANSGFTHHQDYCETNPALVATCFINGDPLAIGAEAADQDVLVGFNWDNNGTTPLPDHLATAGDLGACYGLAYHRASKKIYTSAFIKRHVGLGPLGIGGIYEIDMTDPNNPVIIEFVDVESIGIDVGNIGSNAARGLPIVLDDPSNDPSAYSKIGREGIGALSVSEDGKIWFINLFDKKLYSIIIDADNNPLTSPSVNDVASFTLPNANCTNGEFRPFAVEVFRDQVYVGGVCDGFTSQLRSDLSAIIYQKTGNTFTEIANISLDYDKGWASNADNCENFSGWFAWTDNLPPTCATGFYVQPQPILSEFEFDIDGSIIAGFMDRSGHQLGYKNWPITGTSPLITNVSGGDLLRIDNNNGVYELENNGTAGDLTTGGVGNAQGPGNGEFYFEDIFAGPADNIPGPPHAETTQGGLAFYRGSGDVATTSIDPYSTLFNSGGVNWLNNLDGTIQNPGYVLYRSSTSSISTFAKANGLGSLTVLCPDNPPLQIGKYIWNDTDSDGIQDACEMGLASINVTLYDITGAILQTTTTDANGYYVFTDLTPNTQFYIVAGSGGQFNPLTAQLNGSLFVTMNDIGDGTDPDKTDSDAQIAGTQGNSSFVGMPFISIMTGDYGFVTNSADFGFSGVNVNPVGGIGGFVWEDADEDGIQDGGESGIEGVTVSIFDENDNLLESVLSDASGNYFFSNVSSGNYYLQFDESTNTNGVTNYLTAPQDQGGDDSLDSDINPSNNQTDIFSYDPNAGNLNNISAGFIEPSGSVGGFVWNDENEDGIQNNGEGGLEGITVNLINTATGLTEQTVQSNQDGEYSFSDILLGTYIIEFDQSTNALGIFNLTNSPQDQGGDDNIDSDANPSTGQTNPIVYDPTNGELNNVSAGFYELAGSISGFVWQDDDENGIQDNGEIGIEGATVIIHDANSTLALAMTTADAIGAYSFQNISGGNYYIVFHPVTNVAGIADYKGTIMDAGNNDLIDSDANPNTGQTENFLFDPNNGISSISAGFFIPNETIGGFVWLDIDMDGIQDNNEEGIENATVILFDEDDNEVATLLTNSNGLYGFEDIQVGNYSLQFDFSTTDNPNYEYTLQDQGNDDLIDSDVDPNTGETILFNFNPNQGSDNSWSAGLILSFGMIGDFVFYDCNGNGFQDLGESGIGNVPVYLIQNGIVIDSMTTFNSGAYLFNNIPTGTYSIKFGSPVGFPDYYLVAQDIGGDDAFDSDPNPNTGETAPFMVFGGQEFFDIDAGFTSDNDFPVFINPPQDENLPCSNPQVIDPPTVVVIDNDDDDLDIIYSENVVTGNGDCDGGITIIRTWEATDDCGNTTTHTQTISSIDELPPVIIGIPDITVECDSLPEIGDVKAIDDCDQDIDLTYSDSLIMDGECMQLILRKWIATDDCGNMTMNLQKITTKDMEAPKINLVHPLLTDLQGGGAIILECQNIVDFVLEDALVMDNCDLDPILILTVSSQIGDCETEGFYEKITYVWLAEDACGNTSSVTLLVYLTDETEPVAMNIPLDITVECNNIPLPSIPVFSDNCDDDLIISFTESVLGDTCSDYQILRTWMAMDECNNTTTVEQAITVELAETMLLNIPDDITVECDDIPLPADPEFSNNCDDNLMVSFTESILGDTCQDYQIIRTWTATNDCNNATTVEQIITVEIAETILLNVPGDVTVECTDIPAPTNVIAQNDCLDVNISFSEELIDRDCEDMIIRTWVATDDCGNQITATQTITLIDSTPPEITFSHPMLMNLMDGYTLVFECDSLLNFNEDDAIVMDDCDEKVEVLFMEMPEIGNCDQDGFKVRLQCCWKAEDSCGNFAEFCIFVEIVDTTAPVLSGIPSDLTIDLSLGEMPPSNPPISVIDNCDTNLLIDFMETQTPGPDDCGYILTRTWKSQDNCGNEVSETQIITAIDICECANVLVNSYMVNPTDCNQSNGSIFLDLTGNYQLSLLPNVGTQLSSGFDGLPFGMYELTIIDPEFVDCEETIFFNILKKDCNDTLNVIIDCPIEICIDSSLIDYAGVITSATILNPGNVQTVLATSINDNCVDLEPALGYLGTSPDIISIEICFNGSPDQCDTTYIIVTVEEKPINCQLTFEAEIINPGCADTNGEIILNIGGNLGNLVYDWSPNVSQSNMANNLASGVYEIIITDESTDCFIDTTLILTITDSVNLEQGDVEVIQPNCPLEDGSIISLTNTQYQIFQGQMILGFTPMNNLSPGVYTIVYSIGVCSDSIEIEIIEIPDWLPAFNSTPETCSGNDGSITINLTGGTGNYNYQWSPNVSNSNTTNGLSADSLYSVTVEDENGCSYVYENLFVEKDCDPIPCALELTTVEVLNDQCNQSNGSIELSTSGNQGDVIYSWNPMVSLTNKAVGLSYGIYEIMAMDTAGCLDSIVVEIDSIPATWKGGYIWTDETCAGNDGRIDLIIIDAPDDLTIEWSPNVSDSTSAENLSAGDYFISITDEVGCSESFIATIATETKNWTASTEITHSTCGFNNGSIVIGIAGQASGLSYNWSPNVSNSNEAQNLGEGIYEITVTDDSGCNEFLEVEIIDAPKDWTINPQKTDADCGLNNGTITLEVTGNTSLNYFWNPDISNSNTVTDLSPGQYQVLVLDSLGCKENYTFHIYGGEKDWTVTTTLSDENCQANDGSIQIHVNNDPGNLTFDWTPDVSNTNTANNLSGGIYEIIIADSNGCADTLNSQIYTLITPNWDYQIDTTNETCAKNDGAINLQIFGATGNLIYQWTPNISNSNIANGLSADSLYSVIITDEDGCILELNDLSVLYDCTLPCMDFIDQNSGIYDVSDCDNDASICLEYPLDSMLDLTIYDNGLLYTNGVDGCMNDTTLSYSYFAIPGGGNSGPYELVSWTVNGTTHTTSFNTIQELVDSLNTWDATATWVADYSLESILGGDTESTYSSLSIEQTNTGAMANLELNTKLTPTGSQIYLPVGMHEVILINEDTGCADTVNLEVICITTITITDTIVVNEMETICFDLNELPGDLIFSEVLCPDCDQLNFSILDSCLTYDATAIGEDIAGIIFCDDLGFCDTTWFEVTVIDGQPMPFARIDADTVQSSTPQVLFILSNDEINGSMMYQELLVMPTFGEAYLNIDGTVTYTSNEAYCGLDAFAYEICNEIGCDTATVNLMVKCPKPIPMTGFSPNNDGVNDGFVIAGIEKYPNNELLIFNRWGEKVYQKNNYSNGEWEGTYDNLNLPDGTYFYLLKYGTNGKMSGWVQIER
ncbi:MAG: carboxypeptidase regulatory-like domain-containing protein [Bacteroidetes bacterium]|nr:carboxypeptidase regulatory-like domain-containing protein [Bacteroidota bacterium]